MADRQLAAWPEDLRAVFAAIGALMGAGRLRPELLEALAERRTSIVPGHEARVTHVSGAELGERTGVYVLELQGERWRDGGLRRLRSGELERLARAAARR